MLSLHICLCKLCKLSSMLFLLFPNVVYVVKGPLSPQQCVYPRECAGLSPVPAHSLGQLYSSVIDSSLVKFPCESTNDRLGSVGVQKAGKSR